MSDVMLKASLQGKIRNLRHFKSEALLPVFEAVINSIQAIEEAGDLSKGLITIRVKRDLNQTSLGLEGDDTLPNITGFDIEDNGIGFTNENFDSFQTADSTYKLVKGGKGIGRFLWLKAFDLVEIASTFQHQESALADRNIIFSIDKGVQEQPVEISKAKKRQTVVRLIGFNEDYRKQPSAYKTSTKIAQRVFEHCLARFISDLAPTIQIIDDSADRAINLHDLFNDIKGNITTEHIEIQSKPFSVHHIRLYGTRAQTHQLVYCAHGRDVKRISIGSLLGTSIQFDDDGDKYFYSAYITSPFLDENVDEYRQEFTIPSEPNLLTNSNKEITMNEIQQEVVSRAKNHLAKVITFVETQKAERIAKYTQNESPMLRAVVKYCPEALKDIELNTSDEKMTQVLYSYKGKAEYEIKKNSEKLLRTQATSVDEIKSQYDELTGKLEDFQKDQLAGYVLFRKLIIDLLDKKLELNKDKKYSKEDIVHDIVFPRKADTDIISYENHNLWLVDELLAFHACAASDKRLCDVTTSNSKDRPDILIYSEVGDDRRARVVSLLEFKKPQRKKFDEDPTKQLFRYVRDIRKSGIWQTNGRPVTVDDTTRFYCYAICDITSQITEFAENGNYAKLQGELGYYNYNRNHNAHIEIIAFDKIVLDAKQRHKAFFEKLGIGS